MGHASWLSLLKSFNGSASVGGWFYVVLGFVTFLFVLVELFLILLYIRNRRANPQVGTTVHGNHKIDVLWALIPALILVWMGAYMVQTI